MSLRRWLTRCPTPGGSPIGGGLPDLIDDDPRRAISRCGSARCTRQFARQRYDWLALDAPVRAGGRR